MSDILSVLSVLYPHLSTTSLRQFSGVVFGLLAITGRVSMLNLSRWTSEGGVTGQYNVFSIPLSLGGVFTGCFLAPICWIVKVSPISSQVTKPSCQNRVNRRMVYRVFSRLYMVKRYRV